MALVIPDLDIVTSQLSPNTLCMPTPTLDLARQGIYALQSSSVDTLNDESQDAVHNS